MNLLSVSALNFGSYFLLIIASTVSVIDYNRLLASINRERIIAALLMEVSCSIRYVASPRWISGVSNHCYGSTARAD